MGKRISGAILIGILTIFVINGCGEKKEKENNLSKTEYSEEVVTDILKDTEALLDKTKDNEEEKEQEEKPEESKEKDNSEKDNSEKDKEEDDSKEKKDEDEKDDPLAMEDNIPFEKKKEFLDKYDKLYDKHMNSDRSKLEKVKDEEKEWKKLLNEVLDYLYEDRDGNKVVAIKKDQETWEKSIKKVFEEDTEKEVDKYIKTIPMYQDRIKVLISNYVE